MKAFQAYTKTESVTASTPRAAAEMLFLKHPARRKCNVIEGVVDGSFFTVRYGNPWPASWKEITKKTANTLPDVATP